MGTGRPSGFWAGSGMGLLGRGKKGGKGSTGWAAYWAERGERGTGWAEPVSGVGLGWVRAGLLKGFGFPFSISISISLFYS